MSKLWREWVQERISPTMGAETVAVLVKADGKIAFPVPARGKSFSLKELQTMVGGFIQVVPLPNGVMVCDEEGNFKDYKWNELATRICRGHVFMEGGIMGDALFCPAKAVK